MKKEHKTLMLTAVVTVVLITLINNVSMLKVVKETMNGDDGWF